MQSAGASYLQPQAGDETNREYLEILYEKEAMWLHCAFGHCSDKKLLLSLEKHNVPYRHLRKYISGLTCQACLLSLGHRQYRTMKSTVSSSKPLAVNNSNLPGNRSKFEISTLVPTADATSISAALFSDLLASKHADTPISILSFPTQAELSHARVKQKQAVLDTLNGSAADDPGIVKLKAYKQELDEFIEMAEAIDTQPSDGFTTFQQAHELRAAWADATSLAWDGSRYCLMIVEKNTEYYAASTSKDRSATGAVAMLEDWITETGRVPRTLRLDGAKELVGSEMRDFCRKHNITFQLVPAYNHLLQCWVEGAIRITKSHTRVALKQSGCPLRCWGRDHSARTDIGMPVYDGGIRAYISFLVDTVNARGGTASRGTRRDAVIRCLTLRRQVVTMARRRRGRSRVIRTVNDAWRHARNQRRIATPPDCTCTKAIDNITADRATDSRRACRRVSLLTSMRDVNGAADETISC